MKDAETGRTQTYSTGSDVLAQQFALRVSRLSHESTLNTLLEDVSSTTTEHDVRKRKEKARRVNRLLVPKVPVLFNGCRSGEIFSLDLRQRSRRGQSWKASRFHQESAITSVRVLQDDNYLLAADMLGQVRFIGLVENGQ